MQRKVVGKDKIKVDRCDGMHRGQSVGNGLHSHPAVAPRPLPIPIDLTLWGTLTFWQDICKIHTLCFAQLSLGDLRGVPPPMISYLLHRNFYKSHAKNSLFWQICSNLPCHWTAVTMHPLNSLHWAIINNLDKNSVFQEWPKNAYLVRAHQSVRPKAVLSGDD